MTDCPKMEADAVSTPFPVEAAGLPSPAWTFDMVEDRLVEAIITCWRTPDRERGWQQVRSNWPEAMRELAAGDYDARGGNGTSSDVTLRMASQTRAEIDEMDEAFGWMGHVPADDRRLVAMVITQLARGQREVSWIKMVRKMGGTRGADGMRMRYGRAIAAIAAAKNGGNPRERMSTLTNCTD